jgi:hypothetical protein
VVVFTYFEADQTELSVKNCDRQVERQLDRGKNGKEEGDYICFKGDGAISKYFRCSNDFIMQKVHFSRFMRVYFGLKGLSHKVDLAFDDMYG